MCEQCDPSIGRRAGPKPRTTPATPHMQLDQTAPVTLQERLVALACGLDGVRLGRSGISFPESRAFLLDPERARRGPVAAFMTPGEFAHIHAIWDGSLHMNLPEPTLEKVFAGGWGEPHPMAGRHGLPRTIAMIFGPRDETELDTVWTLVRLSHAFATGASSLE